MTLDPLIMVWEIEMAAADRKCGNCGKKGLTIDSSHDTCESRFTDGNCDCYVDCLCVTCEAPSREHFYFEKPRFVYP